MTSDPQAVAVADPSYVPRRTLSALEAASWLGCTNKSVYHLFGKGELEGYKAPGTGVRIYADSVEHLKLRYANTTKPRPPADAPNVGPAGPVAEKPDAGMVTLSPPATLATRPGAAPRRRPGESKSRVILPYPAGRSR